MLNYGTKRDDETKLPAVFKRIPVRMGAKSQAAGRDIWEDREFIEIYFPGGKTVVSREPREDDKLKYAKEYKAFQDGIQGVHDGTSIEVLPRISPAQVENLKGVKIFTIQHLAQYPDGQVTELGQGGRELKQRAIEYLKAADGAGYVLELKGQIAAQQAQIDELMEKLNPKPKAKEKKVTEVIKVKNEPA